jgi:hydroxybutyrate-dimer hydrolase
MKTTTKRAVSLMASASLAAVIIGAASAGEQADEMKVIHTFYDGVSNDLLTAGLGKTGLGSETAPGFADPLHPTAEELRRSAIYNNYRALIDPTPGGGYGTLYGPNVKPDGTVTASEGLIPGDEYIAYEQDGHGRVTMMVQVPGSFDPMNSCIVTAPSSGSRGVYGAIATAGEWGLKHGCAVA